MNDSFKVGVVGSGYVGLVTGACLASLGNTVTCVDVDEERVEGLRNGVMPIYEPSLEEMVARRYGDGSLSFATGLPEVVREADIVFIAVNTPPDDNGSADLSNVADVARAIGASLAVVERESPLVVVNKSTVPVGSGDYVSMLIREGAEDADVGYRVVSNPEFLREGSAVYDSFYPDRIVLGADSRDALDVMRDLYKPVIEQSFPTEMDPRPKTAVPFVTTDLASAEMIKYAANAFLATKISFINEVATICDLVGADVNNVAAGIGLDGRIGPRFLNAGIGWGGSCFPKDVAALRSIAREYDYEPAILDAAVTVNERQRRQVITKLQRELRTLKGKRVALLGLAFKPNTDDLREAPSLEIAKKLDALGARVVGYDPVAGKAAAATEPSLKVVFDMYEALAGAHAAVVVTEWEEVRSLDLEKAASLMEEPRLLVDGRNLFDPASAERSGLSYRGFGRRGA
ncbi:MAG: UDP-glucose/GDP-mannose dehydrogenase family protein [Rubrobacter sp.]|nr:UDP-glucose/GDP-mannose dehydrogenase family protein [Rubrobacter sp.]